MKLFLIIFDAALEDIVLKTLEKAGFNDYTALPKAIGRGKRSEPHLDSHVWPGYHVIYLIRVAEEESEKMKVELKKLKETYTERGFKVFVLPIQEEI